MRRLVICVGALAVVLIAAGAGDDQAPKAPKACIRALDSAEEVVATAGEALGVAGEGYGLASESYLAILDFDTAALESIVTQVNAGTAELDRLNGVLEPQIERYNRRSTKCRSLAE